MGSLLRSSGLLCWITQCQEEMAEAMHFWSKLLESCKQAHCQPRPSLGHNMASAPSDWHQVGYCLHSGLVCALLQHFTQTSGQLKAEFGQCPSFHLLQASLCSLLLPPEQPLLSPSPILWLLCTSSILYPQDMEVGKLVVVSE